MKKLDQKICHRIFETQQTQSWWGKNSLPQADQPHSYPALQTCWFLPPLLSGSGRKIPNTGSTFSLITAIYLPRREWDKYLEKPEIFQGICCLSVSDDYLHYYYFPIKKEF